MFTRFGTLAISSRKYDMVGKTRKITAVSLAGVMAYNYNQKDKITLNDGTLKFDEVGSLVVPTLEASLRALRLLSTVSIVILEYKWAGIAKDFFPEEDTEKIFWQNTKETREKKLEEAQIAYTSPTSDEVVIKNGKNRVEYVQGLKEEVHHAAESLAEAETKLNSLEDETNNTHGKAAKRLLELCRKNGGVYIKIGQHLANLDYIIPPEYIKVLSSLFDCAPRSSYEDVCRVIKEDLGKHPDELFDSFEKEPIASASLAQVHVAYEKKTGKKLAIKCQHRGLRETSSGDLFALVTVVRGLETLFKGFTFGWLADEIAPHLPKELDFLNEGKNAEVAAKFIEESGLNCIVPRILWNQSSSRVLCMEFEEGFKATDLDAIKKAGLKRRDIATLISSVFSAQVFTPDSPIHVDPHPANVLIREVNGMPQMVLVDHGLYKNVDNSFRMCYARLWRSLMLADLNGIKNACASLGVEKMYTLLAAMLTSRPYDEIMERAKTGSLSANIKDSKSDKAMIAGYARHFLLDILDMLGTLPPQMLLLLKMNDCLRHIDYTLGSPTNTLVITGKYAARAVYLNTLSSSTSWLERAFVWMDYMRVVMKVRAHDLAMWWSEKSN